MSFHAHSQSGARLRCPTCDIFVDPEAKSEWLPFCSERCKLVDLGRWLNEEHAVTCDPDEEEEATPGEASDRQPPKLPPGWHDA